MPPPFSWQTEGSCSTIPPPLPSWPAMLEAEGSCLMVEAEGGRGRKMERQWNEEGGRGRQMERQWNRRGVPCVVGSCQWRGVMGSCQWKGGVGSCLENSNVLPFGPQKIWRGDVGPLVCPVSETKQKNNSHILLSLQPY